MSSFSQSKRPKVLLIEDDLHIRYLLETALRPLKLRLHSFSYGQEALDYFVSDPDFDLIITDLHLPQMHGSEVVQKIRELIPSIPVIIITGHIQSELIQSVVDLNDLKIIEKPITTTSLVAAITQFIDL